MKTFKGNKVTLLGDALSVGSTVENFKVVNNHLEEVTLDNFIEQFLVINVVPSLDTPVCDLQTKTINEEVIKLNSNEINVINISNDLPYAQSRWQDDNEMDFAIILSDYIYHDFGTKFGVLMKENKLLARSTFILNNKREVIYIQIADEMTKHLNLDEIFTFINEMPGI